MGRGADGRRVGDAAVIGSNDSVDAGAAGNYAGDRVSVRMRHHTHHRLCTSLEGQMIGATANGRSRPEADDWYCRSR